VTTPDNNAGTAPTTPVDQSTIESAVRAEVERQSKYLDFAQTQIERDRAFYKHLYTVTGTFIGVLLAIAGIFSYSSISQMRADIKQSVDAELSLVHSQATAATENAKVTVQQELANVRTEVEKRIDTEFRSENIAQMVATAAKQRTESELESIIRSNVATQVQTGIRAQSADIQREVANQTKQEVQQLQPAISKIISDQLAKQVKDSVAPVEAQMKLYGDTISVERLSILAESGDRHSFDQLAGIGFSDNPDVSTDVKKLAQSTVRGVVKQYNNALRRMHYNFNSKLSNDEMLTVLKTSPNAQDRVAALDNLPQTDAALLPTVVKTIQNDPDLEVVTTAFMVFDNITKQSFYFPDFVGVTAWWTNNRATYETNSPSK
jgi:hypothetical protein